MSVTIAVNAFAVSSAVRAALSVNPAANASTGSSQGGAAVAGEGDDGEDDADEAYGEYEGDGEGEGEKPGAGEAAEAPDPTDTSVGAFERGEWGMSLSEIQALEGERVVENAGDGEDYYDYYEDQYETAEQATLTVALDDIYGYHVEATYKFDDDKLFMGQYSMTGKSGDDVTESESFARMRDFMIERYGATYEECEIWYDGGRIDKPSEYEQAFEQGELERCMYWTHEDRLVVFLYMTGMAGLDYPSVIVLVTPIDEGNRAYYGDYFEYFTDITAPQLSRAFDEEQVAAAKRRFVDRKLYVTGTVKSIDAGTGIVILRGDTDAGDVSCAFDDDALIAQLTVGDIVGVIGACKGRAIEQDAVSLSECELDRTEPAYEDLPGMRV